MNFKIIILTFAYISCIEIILAQNPEMLPKSTQKRNQVDRPNFAIGVVGGFKSTYSGYGLSLEYLFFKKIEINAGMAASKFMGVGFSSGLKYYPLGNRKISPFLGCNYISQPGANFGYDNDLPVNYNTMPNNYYVCSIGLRGNDTQLSLIACIDYSIAQYNRPVGVQHGIASASSIDKINMRIKGGLGFTLGFIMHWW